MSDSRIPERDLPQGAAAPTDGVRVVRGGQSMTVPVDTLPMPATARTQIEAVRSELDGVRASQGSGLPGYATRADLPAPGVPNRLVNVTNDPTPGNNGAWRDTGSAWVQSADRVTWLEGRIDTAEGSSAASADFVRSAFYGESAVAYERPPVTRYTTASAVVSYAAGFVSDAPSISRVRAQLVPSALVTKARVRVYRRNGTGFVGPGHASDTLVREVIVDLTAALSPVSAVNRSVELVAEFEPLAVSQTGPTIVAIEALDAAGNVAITGFASAPFEPGSDVWNQGWVQYTSGGSWSLLGPTQAWPAISVDNVVREVVAPTAATGAADVVYFDSNSNAWNGTSFAGWATSFPSHAGVSFDAVVASLGNVQLNESVQVRVFARASAAIATNVPGSSPDDRHLLTRRFRAVDIASDNLLAKRILPLDTTIALPAGFYAIVEITGLLAGGTRGVLGVGQETYGSAPAQQTWALPLSGAFSGIGGNRAPAFGLANLMTASPGLVLPTLRAEVTAQAATIGVHSTAIAGLLTDVAELRGDGAGLGAADVYLPELAIAGRVVTLTGTAFLDGAAHNLSGTFTLARPAASSAVVNGYSLKYTTSTSFAANINLPLMRRKISSVVVTRVSDSVVLTEDVHYGVDYSMGKLYGKVNTPAFAVNVAFNYEKERYDLLQFNPVTRVASIVTGTERDIDALEYQPVHAARNVDLFRLYVRQESVTAVPVYRFDNGVRRDSYAQFANLMGNNRAAIRKTISKLQRGINPTIVGYGDSITSHGGKDLLWYFEFVPADTKSAIPTYDRGDSGGPWAVRTSFIWVAKLAIDAAYGVASTYLNFGVPSTNSGSTAGNGLDPARLGTVLATGADLMVLAFGMNELGSDTTYANIKSIIEQAKAAGMEVVVMAVPRTNGETHTGAIADWRETNRSLQLAAQDAGAAFCPIHWLTDQGGGGLPAADASLCSANFFNHPGITENRIYGELLARIFS